MTSMYTSEQLCVQFYGKYPIDLILYSANVIAKNLATMTISLGFCITVYGWLVNPREMRETIKNVYNEIKQTCETLFTEIWTTARTAITSVWESLSVIIIIQFAFLLLLLMTVPDFIDYFKKALIRFAKLA